jgi:ABC-type amino acid transport substrate-binding protein
MKIRGRVTMGMRKIWLAGALMLGLSAQAAEAADLELLVEDDAAPWSHADGTGYTNDVVKAAYAAVGMPVRLVVVPYARCRSAVLSGNAAGCFNMAWDDEFKGKVTFAEAPLYSNYADVFENRVRPLGAKSAAALPKGKMIGVVNGYEYPDDVNAVRKQGHVRFKELRSEATALTMLSVGRLDGAVIMTNDIEPLMKKIKDSGDRGDIVHAFRAGELKVYIGFSDAHPDGPAARAKFNEGYRQIQANGTLERLRLQWFPPSLAERR